jgi:hypothetical protein
MSEKPKINSQRNLELNPAEIIAAKEEAQKKLSIAAAPLPTPKSIFPSRLNYLAVFAGILLVIIVIAVRSGLHAPTKDSAQARQPGTVDPKAPQTPEEWQIFTTAIPAVDPTGLDLAYRWSGIKRFAFVSEELSGTREEQMYLTELFKVTDVGVLRRVWVMGYQMGYLKTAAPPDVQALTLESLNKLTVPQSMKAVHKQIQKSLQLQNDFLTQYRGSAELRSDPQVKAANMPLLVAYNLLLQQFKNASQRVKDSFFSHISALSLI